MRFRIFTTLLLLWGFLMLACRAAYEPFIQPDPVSVNQIFMLQEVQRFTPMLGMGEFIATFAEPPMPTYAGWADCAQGGRPPWYVHFNRDYIESLDSTLKRPYMSALVGHEMCHHWVTFHKGNCFDEMAAEICSNNLVTVGRPE